MCLRLVVVKELLLNFFSDRFVFELPKNEASLLPVASCVVVQAPSTDPDALKDAKGKPIVRPYTPISSSHQLGELTFLIKKYNSGNASKYIHDMKVCEAYQSGCLAERTIGWGFAGY